MSVITLPRRTAWTTQPPHIVTPVTRKGLYVLDAQNLLLNGRIPAIANNFNIRNVPTPDGMGRQFTIKSDGSIFPAVIPQAAMGSNPFTMFLYAHLPQDLDDAIHVGVKTDTNVQIYFKVGDASPYVRFYDSGGPVISTRPCGTKGLQRIVVRGKNGQVTFDVNNQASETISYGYYLVAGNQLLFGSTGSGTGATIANYLLGGFETRFWTDDEVNAFIQNPWSALFPAKDETMRFDAPAGGGASTAINATTANAVGSIVSKSTCKSAIAATTANSVGSILSSSGLTNTITTPPLKNNTGTLLTGQTGITVNVYHVTTGALVVQKTGQTSHGTTGVVTVTDALITPATQYRVVVILADGSDGLDKITAT